MKERYEEEIARLTRELEARGPPQQIPTQGQMGSSQQPIPTNDPQQQAQINRSHNAFNGIMSGSGNIGMPQPKQSQQQPQGLVPPQGNGPPSYPGYHSNGYPIISNVPPPGSSAPLPSAANGSSNGTTSSATLSPESKRTEAGPNEAPNATPSAQGITNPSGIATTSTSTAPSTPATAPANPVTSSSSASNTNPQNASSSTPVPPTDVQLQKQAEALGNILGISTRFVQSLRRRETIGSLFTMSMLLEFWMLISSIV